MSEISRRVVVGLCASLWFCTSPIVAQPRADKSKGEGVSQIGTFVGTSPCEAAIRSLLHMPHEAEADIIQWKLTLYQEPQAATPSRYVLNCRYGLTVPNQPGIGRSAKTLERVGRWTIAKGTKSNADAVVYDLDGSVSLCKVDQNLLHVLNPDKSLMVGTSGWSYTLNGVEAAEKPGMPPTGNSPDRAISPVSAGAEVFGVFEGRTPHIGIARELKIEADSDIKTKWRVTLYQNPKTGAPTTYKVESSLHRQGAREGNWAIVRGTETDPKAVVYRLDSTNTEAAIFLLKGDDNVLFFLHQDQKPLVGHADFSYTLNRRKTEASGPESSK